MRIFGTVLGLVVGCTLTYLLIQLGLLAYFGPPKVEAPARRMTAPEYEDWQEQRVTPVVVRACIVGAILGGIVGGVAGRDTEARSRRSGRRRHSITLEALTAEQVQMLVQCACPFELAHRTPHYLQGLLVGRLVEIDADLAHTVSRLHSPDLTKLLERVRDRQKHIGIALDSN